MKENVVEEKSRAFAIRIINLYKYLRYEKHEHVLSDQVLRSGTSIGANVKEAIRGQSRPDFFAKLNISLKESSETEYWLDLLWATEFITKEQYSSLYWDCQELIRLLVAITKTQQSD